MSAVCPAGHTSAADDYCDVCGMPIDATAVTPEPAPPSRRSRLTEAAPDRRTSAGQPCPQLRDAERRRRAVLRGLRLRLHHRHACRGR